MGLDQGLAPSRSGQQPEVLGGTEGLGWGLSFAP